MNITADEQLALTERKCRLDNAFLFSDENVLLLKKINEHLQKARLKILAQIDEIFDSPETDMEKERNAQYTIDAHVQLWGKRHGTPNPNAAKNNFYCYTLHQFNRHHSGPGDANAKQQYPDHLIYRDHHCYNLYYLTYLSWEDMLSIEAMWIEIIVTNQYLIDITNG
jgi:hypothetical protein